MSECLRNSKEVEGATPSKCQINGRTSSSSPAPVGRAGQKTGRFRVSDCQRSSAGRNQLDTMKQCKLKGQLSWDWHCSKINKVLMHYKLQKILGLDFTLWKWNFDGSRPKLLQGNIERIARSDLKRQYWWPSEGKAWGQSLMFWIASSTERQSQIDELSANRASANFRIVQHNRFRSRCTYTSNGLHSSFTARSVVSERRCPKARPNHASAWWASTRVRILVIVSRVLFLQKGILNHLKKRWERLTPGTLTRL